MGLFRSLVWVFRVVSFGNYLFRSWEFFLCWFSFFYVVARWISSVILTAFFVMVVWGLLFCYSCTVFNVLSLCCVLLVQGGGICLMLWVFVELVFIFLFVFSACFTVCFLHLCRCRWGLLLSSRWGFTSFSCRCLLCVPLLRYFSPNYVPCVPTIDSPDHPCTSYPDLLIEYCLATMLCGWWPQRS